MLRPPIPFEGGRGGVSFRGSPKRPSRFTPRVVGPHPLGVPTGSPGSRFPIAKVTGYTWPVRPFR